MRTTSFLVLMLWSATASAQTMYKCVDDKGKRTYSNIPCDKQGLKTDGTVTADRVTTMPSGPAALPTQKLKPPVEMPKNTDNEEAGRGGGGGAQVKPVNPLIQQLVK